MSSPFNFYSSIIFALIISLGKTTPEWDYIVFSQSWPSTTCTEWKESSSSHYCTLPKDKSHWIVHGLWPTKNGSEGPSFCEGPDFDETALTPIQDQLEEEWTNVEMPTDHYSFWKHEWMKHGKCASSLPTLDSEFKYFNQGLAFVEKYNIYEMLLTNGVVEGDKPYSGERIYNSVHSALGRVPAVHCVHEKGTGKIFLSEIRLCVDKNLEVIDCVGRNGHEIVNCGNDHQEEVVHYPSPVPTVRDYSSSPPSHHWLWKLLYVLRLLAWFSF